MEKKKTKFALIGCGAIASKHAAAIERLDNACIVGAYDINHAATKKLRDKYYIPTYTDVDKMIDECNPDVLNILTPSGDHAERVMSLAKYNKHFVVEKPLALRLKDVEEILEECNLRGLRLFVVQQNRFNPSVVKLKEAINKGRFGKLVMGTVRLRWMRDQAYYDQKLWRGTWAYDGGVIVNQALHHIDMLLWMMGGVESVQAKTARRLVDIEAEDTAAVVMKFKNGALGIIEATTATRPKDLEGSISILGENGSVEIGGFFMDELKTWNFKYPDEMDTDVWNMHSKVPDMFAWSHTEFFKDVVSSLDEGRSGLIDGIEGRKSVEMINAIYESAETGREIPLYFKPSKCRLGIAG